MISRFNLPERDFPTQKGGKMNSFLKFISLLVAMLIIDLLLSFPVMWLWNGALVPALTIAKSIGYWQAFSILILSQILFRTHSSNKRD